MRKRAFFLVSCLVLFSISCQKDWSPFRGMFGKQDAETAGKGELAGGTFSVEGILAQSELFTGAPETAKRFIIRDPATGAIRAYVQSTKGDVDLSEYVGNSVRVQGAVCQDKVSGLVVEAKTITLLAGEKPSSAVETPPETSAEEAEPEPMSEPTTPKDIMDL